MGTIDNLQCRAHKETEKKERALRGDSGKAGAEGRQREEALHWTQHHRKSSSCPGVREGFSETINALAILRRPRRVIRQLCAAKLSDITVSENWTEFRETTSSAPPTPTRPPCRGGDARMPGKITETKS